MDDAQIAIIGAACRLPGGVDSPASYWQLLNDRRDASSPRRGFNANGSQHQSGRTYAVERAYQLGEDPALFDARFFHINAGEAESMDPQHRLLLEVAHECLEHAGVVQDAAETRTTTGVFAGLMHADYHDLQTRDPDRLPAYMATGTARSCAANRISHAFDWAGPSVTVDTACSSSLTALHLAAASLRAGECDMALVTGSNLLLGEDFFVSGSRLQMLSASGRCRTWDAGADGYARGEGVAAVLLQRLDDAVAAGNSIDAVVRATGLGHDGRTSTLTRPSAARQTQLIQSTYRRAGLDARNPGHRCHFFEAHGTGTAVGDAIETRAIRDAFFAADGQAAAAEPPLLIGAGKTVIGHLEGAAGVAAVIKAVLCLQHRRLPPDLHRERRSPAVPRLLRTPTGAEPLPRGRLLRASVNSFGFGGSNAHAILDYPAPEPCTARTQPAGVLQAGPLVFSAKTPTSLSRALRRFAGHLRADPSIDIADLAWTLRAKRTAYGVRFACAASSLAELTAKLDAAATSPDASFTSLGPGPREPRILAVFTGQGAQWTSMGRQLFLGSRVFKDSIMRSEAVVAELGSPGMLTGELLADDRHSRLHDTTVAQTLCTAVQVACLALLRCAGVRFAAVVGHSSGEIAAAHAAGYLSAADAVRVAYWRGKAVHGASGRDGRAGRMMAVDMPADEAVELCRSPAFSGRLFLAASNSPASVTLSGDADAIVEAKELLRTRDGKEAKLLHVDTAYHSGHMQACAAEYMKLVQTSSISPSPCSEPVPWFSSTHAHQEAADLVPTLRDSYWRDNMVQPVLFSQALENAIRSHGPFDLALEIGPHPALRRPATQTVRAATGEGIPYCGVLHRDRDDASAFAQALSFLWSHAAGLDLEGFRRAHHVSEQQGGARRPAFVRNLPTYAWDHDRRYWCEPTLSRGLRARPDCHELLGAACVGNDPGQARSWRHALRLQDVPWVRGHSLGGLPVFPSAGFCVMALAAAAELPGGRDAAFVELRDVTFSGHVGFPDEGAERELFCRLTRVDDGSGAVFTCEAASGGGQGALDLIFKCRVRVEPGDEAVEQHAMVRSIRPPLDARAVEAGTFYRSLREDIGFSLDGLFESIGDVRRRMDFASATVKDVGATSPQRAVAAFAAAFQTFFLAFAEPGHGDMWAPHLPRTIRCVRAAGALFRRLDDPLPTQVAEVVASLHSERSGSFQGDVELIAAGSGAGSPILRLEDLTCAISKATASAADGSPERVRAVAVQKVWEQDVRSGLELEPEPGATREACAVDALERVCLYYYRSWHEGIPGGRVASARPHFQKLWAFVDELLPAVAGGQHRHLRAEWMRDTRETVSAIQRQHADVVDMQLVKRVGEAMPEVVAGKADMLDVMMRDGLLGRYYVDGVGLAACNAVLAAAAARVAHRFPRMRVLEIGAGTGATTKRVLEAMGSFASYTFTDVSSGFFASARELLREWRGRVEFETLDVEDEAAAAVGGGPYDMVVAANVLHATSDMARTMRNVRRLLKPGGHLLMLEITGGLIRTGFMMSGLAGWWLSKEAHRRCSPRLSTASWTDLLRDTGFSGIDQVQFDSDGAERHMFSVMTSRAVDDTVPFPQAVCLADGRRRLQHPGTVFYVDDQRSTAFEAMHRLFDLLCESSTCTVCPLDPSAEPPLADAERCFVAISEDALRGISQGAEEFKRTWRQFLRQSSQVLLVRMADRAGQKRTGPLLDELSRLLPEEPDAARIPPQVLLMDDTPVTRQQAVALFEDILLPRNASAGVGQTETLWSLEPELALYRNKLWIPRIKPIPAIDEAVHAARRVPLRRLVRTDSRPVTLDMQDDDDGTLSFSTLSTLLPHNIREGDLAVECAYTTAYAIRIGRPPGSFMFLCCGRAAASGTPVFYLSTSRCSRASAPRPEWTLPAPAPGGGADDGAMRAAFATLHAALVALALASAAPDAGSLVIYDPDALLAAPQLEFLRRGGARSVVCVGHASAATTTTTTTTTATTAIVHPHAPRAHIRALVPADAGAFVDLSRQAPGACGRRVRECLPPACVRLDRRALYAATATATATAAVIDRHAIAEAAAYLSSAATSPSLLSLDAIDAGGVEPGLGAVVDWGAGEPVRARVAPAAPPSFRAERCYVYAYAGGGGGGGGDALARAWCGFAARRGARRIALLAAGAAAAGGSAPWCGELEARGVSVRVCRVDREEEEVVDGLEGVGEIGGIVHASSPSDGGVEAERCARAVEGMAARAHEGAFLVRLCGASGGDWWDDGDRLLDDHRERRCVRVGVPDRLLQQPACGNGDDYGDVFACTGLSERDFHQFLAEVVAVSLRMASGQEPQSLQAPSLFLKGTDPIPGNDPRLSTLAVDFSRAAQSDSGEGSAGQSTAAPSLSVRELLASADGDDEARRDIICSDLARRLTNILQLQDCSLIANNKSMPLAALGCDSLVAIEIRRYLWDQLEVDVPVVEILEDSTSIDRLCQLILDQLSI